MKRINKKRLLILIVVFIITLLFIFLIINYIFKDNGSKKYYSDYTIKVIKDENLENIYDYDYSKTLEEVIKSNSYNAEYLEDYIDINYNDSKDFVNKINNYLNIGYSGKEINDIFKLSTKNQEKLLNLSKQEFKNYINISNFNIDNLQRYIDYKNKTNYSLEKIVTYVNIGLDNDFYSNTKSVTNPNDLTTIVNKYNYLDKDFVPQNLVTLFDNPNAKMVDVAAEAYKKFIEAAKKDGITLQSTTAYRSYSFQNILYTNYVAKDGVEKADTYSARPGTSEHQLGLAVDLNDPYVTGSRLDNKDYEWVLNNSYKYGFIVRYTESGVPITGYMEEPWHIRYLGVDLATKVKESNLTYEEYYDLYMTEY